MLVIEREQLIRKYIISCVIPFGTFEIVEANDRDDFSKIIGRCKPLVVIYDLQLHSEQITAMIKSSRNSENESLTYFIATSVVKDDKKASQAYKGGADYYLGKSFSRHELKGIMQNILRHEDFRKKLLMQEQYYRMLFEMTADPIMLIKLENLEILDANRSAGPVYGYGNDSLSGMKFDSLAADPEKSREILRNQTSFAGLTQQRRKDGSLFKVHMSCAYFKKNQTKVALVTVTDMSEKLLFQEEKEALFRIKSGNDQKHQNSEIMAVLTGEYNERRRISREIHENTGQILVSAKLQLENCIPKLKSNKEHPVLISIRDDLVKAISSLRKLLSKVVNDYLPGKTLKESLENLADQMKMRNMLDVVCSINYTPDIISTYIQTNIYRIAEESLANAMKHSADNRAELRLHCSDNNEIILEIVSYGVDNNFAFKSSGIGLRIMQQRASLIGGAIIFKATNQSTFEVKLTVPAGITIS